MKIRILATAIAIGFAGCAAFAQTTAPSTVQRDVNQQTRIEQGLKTGSLSTAEAARLEKQQSQIERLQARELKNGKLTAAERARLTAAQDKASHDIHAAKTNDVKGNPQSASSERMQADVQGNVNQQKRIEQGVQSGALTKHEAGALERGQAKIDHKEYVAGRDGKVGRREQLAVQRAQNHQSKRIHTQKHDARTAPAA